MNGNNMTFDSLPPEVQQNIRNILSPNQSASRYMSQMDLDRVRAKAKFARLPEDVQKMVKRDLVLGRAHLHRLRTAEGAPPPPPPPRHRRRRSSSSSRGGRRRRASRSRSRSGSRRRRRSASTSPHRRRRRPCRC